MEPRLTLEKLFRSHQQVMSTRLQGARATVPHAPSKGATSEHHWIDMLVNHLPSRYTANRIFVIDYTGAMSEQIDIGIYDSHYSPVLLDDGGVIYVPAESVYAVFEVRQELNRTSVGDAGQKAGSVRRLRRTSAPIPSAWGTHAARTPPPILAGLLSLTSSWSPPFGDAFLRSLRSLAPEESLQSGCALDDGAWRVANDDGPVPTIEVSAPDTALIRFFLNLLADLQKVATVPAIELDRYAAALPDQRKPGDRGRAQ